MKRLLVLALLTSGCSHILPTRGPEMTSFTIVSCAVSTLPKACDIPIAGAAVGVRVSKDNGGSYLTQTTNAKGETRFIVPKSLRVTQVIVVATQYEKLFLNNFDTWEAAFCNDRCQNVVVPKRIWPKEPPQ